jgi:hypothetical protein
MDSSLNGPKAKATLMPNVGPLPPQETGCRHHIAENGRQQRPAGSTAALAAGQAPTDRRTILLPAFIVVSGRHPSSRETPMRILALAILTMVTASAAPSARAQTYDPAYPVCLQVYQGMADFYFECTYTSLAQCNASASGRAASCIVNPYYAGPKKTPPGRKHRRHH